MLAVQSYLNGEESYNMIKEKYQIRSSTQLKNWIKKYKEFGVITDTRGRNDGIKGISNPLKGSVFISKGLRRNVTTIWHRLNI
ncbi:transposase [Bacillus sp. FSL L8-0199]|uniref:helix-turn-helix domain-containing protein n=1 Tax=Bacillus TaxID=1386 RepID=UPI0020CCF732|nr:transposase [Bacillus thuringiensis]